ncbi:MAG: hypothetical protein GQF41_0915 [Candidatus Rifleibacterium amylolyticum]|nr:MAG: hypothetical protein GQF41_0915 [Candidatus Rifleibacterium amylolyticum]
MQRIIGVLLVLCLFSVFLPLYAETLTAEKPVEFNFSKEEDAAVFELMHPGDRFLAFSVEFAEQSAATGGLTMSGANTIESGPVVWNNRFDRDVFVHDGPASIIDNMKPAPGGWNLAIKPVAVPVSGKIRLIDLGPAGKIDYTWKTGAIKICKPENNDIIALNDVSHPDFPGSGPEFTGSVTAAGDVMIPLPVGLYTLRSAGPLVNTIQAHMIPVHAGKITIIENWPKTVQPEGGKDDEQMAAALASDSLLVERELKIRNVRLLADEQVSVRFATPNWQGVVNKEELEIKEGGMPAEILSAGSVATPLSLTILLDSSGSMKKDMKLALASVEQFIRLLPEDSEIVLVDFDTKAKEIAAKDRNGLLKALKGVRADGATCLNDSVMLGLQKSEGKGRPAVLLFTDGFDANHNDTGPGSKTKPEEMFAAVKTAEVPVFTIGFGKKPDEATLKRLATLSGGRYHQANSENIDKVFAQVASMLGREHELVYRRPGMRGNSDAPVINVVLDVSGSMDMPPSEDGCDYRMEKAKAILRDLFSKLPENAIAQLMIYNLHKDIIQIFTSDRMHLVASLAPVTAGGGTATLEALQIAFRTLNEVPSDRRYLLFITDAGLDLDPAAVTPDYEAVLGSLKDAGIQTTWVGMVGDGEKAPFDMAAKLCAGKAVVSTDLNAVREAVENFGKTIVTASASTDMKTPVLLTFSRREENGRLLVMSAAEKSELPPPPVVEKASVNGLKVSFADLPPQFERYSLDLSQSLYGSSKTRDETVITQRMPLSATVANRAMRLTAVEMLIMSSFRGVSASCVAVKMRFENILPEQTITEISGSEGHPASIVGNSGQTGKTVKMVPPYLIPDVRMHFFARFNQQAAVPVSDLSWIVEDPLITPEDESLCINAGEAVEGWLVFEYKDAGVLKNAAIDFYDTVYGNLRLTLTGVADALEDPAKVAKLPTAVNGKLSDAFEISLTGFADSPLTDAMEDYLLRVFELQVTSKVQALLDIDPRERLTMLVPTHYGDLVLRPSPRTADLPLGWYRPTMFLPGSYNIRKQAYLLPKSLGEKLKGTLRVDIAGGELLLSAGDQPVKADKPLATGKGDKISLAVNTSRFDNMALYLDLTLVDEKDGEGTSIPVSDLCRLELNGETFVANDEINDYLFQPGDQVEVADGRSRRFLIVVSCPDVEKISGAELKSELFQLNMKVTADKMGKFDDYMLAGVDVISTQTEEEDPIRTLAASMHAERVARGWQKKGAVASRQIVTDKADSPDSETKHSSEGEVVLPAPDFKSVTDARLQAMLKMNAADFAAALGSIRCIPSDRLSRQGIYAPEAVLLQNWGTPSDLLEIARIYYKTAGELVADEFKYATLTEGGKEELAKVTGWKSEISELPVLIVGARNLVFPFMKDAAELDELIESDLAKDPAEGYQPTAVISIMLKARSKNADQAAMMGSMAGALGGGDDDGGISEIPLFESNALDYAMCSQSPLDIFYYSPDNGKTLCVSAESACGKIENLREPVSLADHEIVEEVIQIRLEEEILGFVRPLEKNVSIVDTFRTFALCMPDLTASASSALAADFAARKTVDAPGTRSTARWFAWSKIYQFLALQSGAEAEAARETGVRVGRPGQRMRVIILTLTGEGEHLRAELDLRQINPIVQGDEQAIKAFNFFMGMANTMIEEQVMGGGSLFSRWRAGASQRLMVAGPEDIPALIEGLATENLIESTVNLLQNAADNGRGVIFPLMAPLIDGKLRPAWFVFNPETYEMISVLDNGAHGSLVEKPITEIISDAAKYSVGFLIGTNVSLWSMVTYSIVYDDAKKIVKAAKALSLEIAKCIKDIGKPLDALLPEIPDSYTAREIEATAGPASIKVGFGNLSADGFKLMTKPSISFNFSYQSGFEDAVKLYFKGN